MTGLYTLVAMLVTYVGFISMATVAKPQHGCCYSNQYEGKMFITKGDFNKGTNSASLTHTEATLHVDYTKTLSSIESVSTTQPGGAVRSYRLIEDWGKKQGWYIVGQTCYKVPVSTPGVPFPCLPDGSTLLGEFTVDSLVAQTWTLPSTNTSTALQRVTVAVTGCVPIQYTGVDFGTKSSMTTTTFGNLTKGIADPSVFDVPSFCT